jgi:hypothetical protein
MATRYERVVEVIQSDINGIEVTLALQRRFSPGLDPWFTVSWRTRLRPGGPNRRFDIHRALGWSIGAHFASEMFDEFEHCGGFDPRYHDGLRTSESRTSDGVGAGAAESIFEEVTYPGEDWGERPYWVILGDEPPVYGDSWRKILIVDPSTGRATFRSKTTSPTYRPRAILRPGREWVLDNSMHDTTVQQAIGFRNKLRDLFGTLEIPRWTGAPAA